MRKKVLIIVLIFVLLILFIIFKEVNYDKTEFKLGLKSLLRQELTFDEMKNSNLYKAYKKINYNTSLDEIDNIMKKESNNVANMFKSWDLFYGNILIWFSNDTKSKVYVKLINFETPYTIELNDNEFNSLFKCKYLEEIIDILGEPIMLTVSYNENGEITEYTYEWGIKANYFEPQQYYQLPYKRKLRARVSVGEDNLIWTVNIDKY